MADERAAMLKQVADLMRDLDFCMMTTQSEEGGLRSRPMSNNGEVEFDGDVWFFSGADTRKVADIHADPSVELTFANPERFIFISMSGDAEIITDVEKKRELWLEELERWFEEGPDSEDVVLIKVTPTTIGYWKGEDEGEIDLA